METSLALRLDLLSLVWTNVPFLPLPHFHDDAFDPAPAQILHLEM
jgi:hypothetical protein